MPIEKVGARQVVESGCAAVYREAGSLRLTYKDLSFVLTFDDEGDGASATVATTIIELTKTLEVRLRGFSNPLGTIWDSEVGTVGGRRLFLTLSVHGIGDAKQRPRTLTYTLSLGEGVNA